MGYQSSRSPFRLSASQLWIEPKCGSGLTSAFLPQLKEINVDVAGSRFWGSSLLAELSGPVLIPGEGVGIGSEKSREANDP